MGLLIRGSDSHNCLHCDGCFHWLRKYFGSLDIAGHSYLMGDARVQEGCYLDSLDQHCFLCKAFDRSNIPQPLLCHMHCPQGGLWESDMKTVCVTLLLFAIILFKVGSRSLQHSSSNLVSDGNDNIEVVTQTSLLVFGGIDSSEDCSLLSGLFPCSYTVLGKLFLIVGYVLLYIIGEYYVVAGGELIFEVNGSVGANLFHFLSAIPDAIILLGSGVSTEIWTTYAARIMVISIIPVVVSQIPQVLHLSTGGQGLAILIALIVSVILTIAYIFYEVTDSLIC